MIAVAKTASSAGRKGVTLWIKVGDKIGWTGAVGHRFGNRIELDVACIAAE